MPKNKLNLQNFHTEDFSLPFETRIYYSKNKAWFQIISMAAFMAWIVLVCIHSSFNMILIYIPIATLSLYLVYNGFSRLHSIAQIILNDKGIETVNTPFAVWSNVTNESFTTFWQLKILNISFNYEVFYDSESVDMNTLDINKEQLEKLLNTYRLRSERILSVSSKLTAVKNRPQNLTNYKSAIC